MTNTWPLQRDCNDFYGNRRGANGGANAAWEKNNLVLVKAPWRLVLAWETDTPVSGIRVHKRCAESLGRILDAIWDRFSHSEDAIRAVGMHLLGGGYNFRTMRGSNALSMHSWGCAVDFDPDRNSLGDRTPAMDRRVIECFEAEGWEWGGHWDRPDGMHFQAAHTSASPKRLSGGAVAPGVPDVSRPPEKNSVKELQLALQSVGFDPGAVDGLKGPNTFAAVRRFQEAHGLKIDGMAGNETWKALRAAVAAKKEPPATLVPPPPCARPSLAPATPPVAAPAPALAPAAPPATSVPVTNAPVEVTKEVAEFVQRRLRELNYTHVGNVDGDVGSWSQAAILAFRNDNALPLVPTIDGQLLVALAGAKPKPIAETRAKASPAEVAAKIPAVAAAQAAGLWAKVQALGAFVLACITGMIDWAGAATEKLTPLQAMFGSAPIWLLIAAVAGVSFLLWRNSRAATADTVDAYRSARLM